MAPEVVGRADTYGLAADIFSLGIVVHEILSLRKPYSKKFVANDPRVVIYVASGGRPDLNELPASKNIADADLLPSLLSKCWLEAPERRPRCADVVTQLEFIAARWTSLEAYTEG